MAADPPVAHGVWVCRNPACSTYASIEKPDPLLCPVCNWTLVLSRNTAHAQQGGPEWKDEGQAAPSIPARLRIGHVHYVVHHSDAHINEVSFHASRQYAGYSNGAQCLIGVREDMHPDVEAETLLHEILHQCLRVTATDPDKDAQAGCQDIEERTVAALAGPLLSTLRDNPALLTYLLHRKDPA
jgi:hypothetical protein